MDPSIFVNMIIRPPRADYQEPGTFEKSVKMGDKDVVFKAEKFEITNPRGEKLNCQWVEPKNEADRPSADMPTVIYMHGNGSNKMEGLSMWEEVCARGFQFCSFDFSGTGKSEGDWVTLGFQEKDDLKSLVQYLYENKKVSSIGFWGRSMGAVTSVLYMADDENAGTFNCAVLDSGFCSIEYLMNSLAGTMGIPPDMVAMLSPMIMMAVQ
jgi:predicted alpha/beta-fold hydrolase